MEISFGIRIVAFLATAYSFHRVRKANDIKTQIEATMAWTGTTIILWILDIMRQLGY